jgi:anti-anti-sigma regulatory factor
VRTLLQASPAGDLDLSAVKDFERAMRPALKHGGPVTIDASPLMFVDSRGIRLLMHTAHRLEPSGCLILHDRPTAFARSDVSGNADLVPNIHVLDHKVGKQGAA